MVGDYVVLKRLSGIWTCLIVSLGEVGRIVTSFYNNVLVHFMWCIFISISVIWMLDDRMVMKDLNGCGISD